ncbi:uncharacterized protein C11orf97 homolog [Pelodytes ibericus]
MKRQPRSSGRGGNVALWRLATEDEAATNGWEEQEFASPVGSRPHRKNFFYVGTPKRIQQITEEERFLQKDEIQVTPALPGIALEDIRQTGTNMQMRPVNPIPLARNSFLTQPEHYSRHRGTGVLPRQSRLMNGALSVKTEQFALEAEQNGSLYGEQASYLDKLLVCLA